MDAVYAPKMTDHQMMLYAALQLVEAQDAGKDTTSARELYDECRTRMEAAQRELQTWLADGAPLDDSPKA